MYEDSSTVGVHGPAEKLATVAGTGLCRGPSDGTWYGLCVCGFRTRNYDDKANATTALVRHVRDGMREGSANVASE